MTLSSAGRASINASETGEIWLALLRLSHPSWVDDERLVSDQSDIVHNGETFKAFGFEVSRPDQTDGGNQEIRWRAQNVDRELVTRFRSVSGPIAVEMFFILASEPDVIQDGPYDAELTAAEYNAAEIGGSFQAYPVHDENWTQQRFTAQDFPGLF